MRAMATTVTELSRTPATRIPHHSLFFILFAYLALAILFAVITPAWQNPDEPAHYNYVAQIARGEGLPVLQMGDYDAAYLETLKSKRFPDNFPIDPVRYEAHQPPLYYLLAAPVFWLSGGSLSALRLFSALLGGAVIWLIFKTIETIWPERPLLALGSAAFAALLPMHLAMLAAVNNDALAEVIIAATMFLIVRWMKADGTLHPSPFTLHPSPFATPLLLGILIGLGFLTKATVYILLPVVGISVGLFSLSRWGWRRAFGNVLILLPWALLLGAPLWLRNMETYGAWDFLGLQWHDQVVTGQPTTLDWIAANGWAVYRERAWTFTFRSFWGVFGWMGVFMDGRMYTVLAVATVLAVVGLLSLPFQKLPPSFSSAARGWAILALVLLLLSVCAAYVWYNLGFVQHQGRYLFPALLPLSLGFAVGWYALLRPLPSLGAVVVLLVWLLGEAMRGTVGGDLNVWTLAILSGAITALLLNLGLTLRFHRWAEPHPLVYAIPFVALALIDVAIPFMYIGPQLR